MCGRIFWRRSQTAIEAIRKDERTEDDEDEKEDDVSKDVFSMNQTPSMQYTVEKKVYQNYNKEFVSGGPHPGMVKDHTLIFLFF